MTIFNYFITFSNYIRTIVCFDEERFQYLTVTHSIKLEKKTWIGLEHT